MPLRRPSTRRPANCHRMRVEVQWLTVQTMLTAPRTWHEASIAMAMQVREEIGGRVRFGCPVALSLDRVANWAGRER
jgi:hypothetical protein